MNFKNIHFTQSRELNANQYKQYRKKRSFASVIGRQFVSPSLADIEGNCDN